MKQMHSAWKPRDAFHLCETMGEKVHAGREGRVSGVIMDHLRQNDPQSNIEKQNSLFLSSSIYSNSLLFSFNASAISFHDIFLFLVPLPVFINQIIHLHHKASAMIANPTGSRNGYKVKLF